MIKLRPHHLLCTITFKGDGYTREFEKNFKTIIARINAGEMIRITDEPDDICKPVCALKGHHCFEERIKGRDKRALADINNHLGRSYSIGDTIDPKILFAKETREGFATGIIRKACKGCQWKPFCDAIAVAGFKGTFLTQIGKE